MWFVAADDLAVSMATFRGTQKIVNLQRDPRVSLLVESGREYSELKGVVMYGTAELSEDTDAIIATLVACVAKRSRRNLDAEARNNAGRGHEEIRLEARPDPRQARPNRLLGPLQTPRHLLADSESNSRIRSTARFWNGWASARNGSLSTQVQPFQNRPDLARSHQDAQDGDFSLQS